MAINVTVDPTECYERFASKGLFDAPPPGSPPATQDQLVRANIELFPPLTQASAKRTIRWKTKAAILAVEKKGEGIAIGVLTDLFDLVADVAPTAVPEMGFPNPSEVLSHLARIGRSVRDRIIPNFDMRVFRLDPLEIKFSAPGGQEPSGISYGYVVDTEARWFKDDWDDPEDHGFMVCQLLKDTNDVLGRGNKVRSGNDLPTDKYIGPLLVSGPHDLGTSSVQVELDVLGTAEVDREILPGVESFLTVVRSLSLRIITGTQAEVQTALDRARAGTESKELSFSVERSGARIAKAVRPASAGRSSSRAKPQLEQLAKELAGGKTSKIHDFIAALPSERLLALGVELGLTDASETDIGKIKTAIAAHFEVP